MNAVRKKPRLDPSRPLATTDTTSCDFQPLSHDAPQLPPHTPVARGGVEEDEDVEEEMLLVEEDTTDSSLIITMGNTYTHTHCC